MYVKNEVEKEEAQQKQKFDKHCPNHLMTVRAIDQQFSQFDLALQRRCHAEDLI